MMGTGGQMNGLRIFTGVIVQRIDSTSKTALTTEKRGTMEDYALNVRMTTLLSQDTSVPNDPLIPTQSSNS